LHVNVAVNQLVIGIEVHLFERERVAGTSYFISRIHIRTRANNHIVRGSDIPGGGPTKRLSLVFVRQVEDDTVIGLVVVHDVTMVVLTVRTLITE
jgi:hypothetical protein